MHRRIRSDLPPRYGPLLDYFREFPGFHHATNAELCRLALFFLDAYVNEKNAAGKTRLDVVLEHWHNGATREQVTFRFKEAFEAFEKGINPDTPPGAQ